MTPGQLLGQVGGGAIGTLDGRGGGARDGRAVIARTVIGIVATAPDGRDQHHGDERPRPNEPARVHPLP